MAQPALKMSMVRADGAEASAGLRLADLDKLALTDIETRLVANVSRDLHTLFDPVSNDVLPIYFGPLLGRLYLEGL